MTARARPSHHSSPLRYPGGKAKLAPFFKMLIRDNNLLDCTYVEPFAGGAGAGVTLLLHGYVNDIVLNDLSEPIFCFWKALLNEPDRFEKDILEIPLSVGEWEKQREIFQCTPADDEYALGFAAFYLNRTNHSGVLNGGMIGGYAQKSRYGLDARFNRSELAARVKRIARQRDKITVLNYDALSLLSQLDRHCSLANSLIYIDPPYFTKGRDLYYDYYRASDHELLRDGILALPEGTHWVVSYDDVDAIRSLYAGESVLTCSLSYSVRNGRSGNEVIFLAPGLVARVGCLDPLQMQKAASDHHVTEGRSHVQHPLHELPAY